MKTTLLGAVLALAGLVVSQAGLPTCAQNCVLQFTTGSQIGSCGSLDAKCICSSSSFLNNIACCLAAACDAADQATAVEYAKEICTTQGVTVPDVVSCASSSITAGVTSGASSAGNSPSATSGAVASTASTTSSAPASQTKNAGVQNAAGAGVSFAGGLAAVLAFL